MSIEEDEIIRQARNDDTWYVREKAVRRETLNQERQRRSLLEPKKPRKKLPVDQRTGPPGFLGRR